MELTKEDLDRATEVAFLRQKVQEYEKLAGELKTQIEELMARINVPTETL